jgi:hypothetical protein
MMRRYWYALAIVLALSCSYIVQPPDYAADAAEYDALSIEYESIGNQLEKARRLGKMTASEWREFDDAQGRMADLGIDIEDLFARWRQTGVKPDRFDATFEELRDEMAALRKLLRRVTVPSHSRSARPATRKAA